ncbi:DUF421 domain-containing protein [Hoyosella sp. G463]|uniref:DUF421 domain-containing protein n=1 Tax=Lolliginicoccus lacisalsi TaxID=2742202 RepID=A0A927PL29_9ACTN|nr:YetF domain-containing protein [Lolliginicoccus lacisalsi]MBD8504967.1 DUF421 domain-containing protein [Lolliginicoccus lacisalsi]
MWFDTLEEIIRIIVVGTAAYVDLILVLRISGKRTLAKLNAFDFVVTVALGSTLATIVLSGDVSWAEGATALVLLAALQFIAAFVSSRIPGARDALTAAPTLLLEDGAIVEPALRAQRVSRAEVMQAVRSTGLGDLSRVAAVVLETNGSLSVIPADARGDGSSLADVRGRGAAEDA